MPNTYGYIRVRTREQNEDRQLIALREISVPEQNIFVNKLPVTFWNNRIGIKHCID